MAYTLYSDGSIEAQLPQGKLRFGSITALRNHIERNGSFPSAGLDNRVSRMFIERGLRPGLFAAPEKFNLRNSV